MSPYRRLLARLEAARTLGVSLGLDRVRGALERLGHPERAQPSRRDSADRAGVHGPREVVRSVAAAPR